jgi:hypothetical protein
MFREARSLARCWKEEHEDNYKNVLLKEIMNFNMSVIQCRSHKKKKAADDEGKKYG